MFDQLTYANAFVQGAFNFSRCASGHDRMGVGAWSHEEMQRELPCATPVHQLVRDWATEFGPTLQALLPGGVLGGHAVRRRLGWKHRRPFGLQLGGQEQQTQEAVALLCGVGGPASHGVPGQLAGVGEGQRGGSQEVVVPPSTLRGRHADIGHLERFVSLFGCVGCGRCP